MTIVRNPFFIAFSVFLVLVLLLALYFDHEPGFLTLDDSQSADQTVVGVATTSMLVQSVETLLNKRGGYLSNDVLPPSSLLDNVPNWEFGVLQQVRDLAKTLRNDYSRSQTQSIPDSDLEIAEPKFNVSNDAWMFPSAEGEYQDGVKYIKKYLVRLQDTSTQNAQFYARADNLKEWLGLVEKRLGALSLRLSQARPQLRINTDLAGDANAEQSTSAASQVIAKSSWFEIDDNFYEARGTSWALIHYLRAAEIDFKSVLEDKNAIPTLRQIIRELESTQQEVDSPMILNGSGMGMFANHSLVMSSYISRANSGVSQLINLLADG